MVVQKPLPITIENGPEKLTGCIMKLTAMGLMVELDKITFKAGSYVTLNFFLNEKTNIIERARSIKHYDKYFRKSPPKKLKEGEAPPVPKMLCELHFEKISEPARTAITKYLLLTKSKEK